MAKYVGNSLKILNGEVYNGTIFTEIDMDYVASEVVHDVKFYFTPTQARIINLTKGAVSIGTTAEVRNLGTSANITV